MSSISREYKKPLLPPPSARRRDQSHSLCIATLSIMNSIPAARSPFWSVLRAFAAGAAAQERSVVTPDRPASDDDVAKTKRKKMHL